MNIFNDFFCKFDNLMLLEVQYFQVDIGFRIIKQIIINMFEWRRSSSCELPRQKIFLTSLNQLIDRKVVMQPEVETNNKLFPQRPFAKKLSMSHQRIKSSLQIRSKKFDLHWTSKNAKNMVVESNRYGTSQQNKRESHQQFQQLRTTHLSQAYARQDINVNPLLKISLVSSGSSPDSYNFSSQSFKERVASLQLKAESPQKNFLRKGSNLQKQIVINLLRNKIVKEKQLNQKKQYSNQEIIKMIQVFKGVALTQSNKQKKGLLNDAKHFNLSPIKKKNDNKQLQGWEQQPLGDYQENDDK